MKRTALAGIAALTLAIAACGGSSGSNSAPASGTSPTGTVTIQWWHAQTPPTDKVMQQLASSFNASHPHIVVQASSGGTASGDLLPKVTTALAAGTAPDVAYIYGSYAANIAQSGKTVNLKNIIHTPGYNWNDLYPASQQIVSPGGKVIGFPALIDNLSVIYNKKLFAAAGVPVPQLDLGPVPRRREEDDQPRQAHLRRELPHRRGSARHVLAVLPGPLAARRADPLARPQEGAVQLAGRRSEPDAVAADGNRRPFGVPGPDGPEGRAAVHERAPGDVRQRPVGGPDAEPGEGRLGGRAAAGRDHQ